MLSLSEFDYDLPPDRIAQTPLEQRDASRLMTLDRNDGSIRHRLFREIPDLLLPGDTLVLNDTRVSAMRLFGWRPGKTGERLEAFLTHRVAPGLWRALVRPGKKMLPGVAVEFENGLTASVLERSDDRGGRILQFSAPEGKDVEQELYSASLAPLPPYIAEPLPAANRDRYQTVYSRAEGSAAAPTAGLHFTPALLEDIRDRGVDTVHVTLHVGLGTFRPIESDDIESHAMHSEEIHVTEEAADRINGAKGRIIAVGTTSLRTLESAAVGHKRVAPFRGETSLFIRPGYDFKMIDALITNFHMPRSTLLVLVSALAGRENIRRAYSEAMDQRYRFLSFGDAMFIA